MDVREKLLELFYDNNMICDQKIEGLADDVVGIIANGVTVQEWIDKAPTIDAVPVVRCKDCIHSYDDLCGLCCAYGVCVDCIVQPEFYCADGKRKENE